VLSQGIRSESLHHCEFDKGGFYQLDCKPGSEVSSDPD
jgi:hypothetical protein